MQLYAVRLRERKRMKDGGGGRQRQRQRERERERERETERERERESDVQCDLHVFQPSMADTTETYQFGNVFQSTMITQL
jgi:hypothetical protein